MKYIGDISQVASVTKYVLDDGKGRGMRIFDVKNGSGLRFSVVPDRGLDIMHCDYKGIPISFISKTGLVSPAYYEHENTGFLRSFTAGLLTTCGYTYMGAACEDEGESLGLHGRATSLVSEETGACGFWDGDDYIISISGMMREAAAFGENIHLIRQITCRAGQNVIYIDDTYENYGYDPQPFMVLYHCNFGYPVVSQDSSLTTSKSNGVIPRDSIAAAGIDNYSCFTAPIHDFCEQVFFHNLVPDSEGMAWARMENRKLGLHVTLRYSTQYLPYLIQWKQTGEGDYACGLEPATWLPKGRSEARKLGQLEMIQPGEIKKMHLEFSVGEVK